MASVFILLDYAADDLAKNPGDLDLLTAAIRVFSLEGSACFHPDPWKKLPGIFNILYSGVYLYS